MPVASIVNVLQSAVASAERVFELLDEAEEVTDPVAPAILAEPAAGASTPAGARPHALVVEEERAVALGHLHRRARDIAGPRQHVLAVLPRGRDRSPVEE